MRCDPRIYEGVQMGHGSNEGDENPYEKGSKEYHGWNEGYESAREDERKERLFANLPWYRQILCGVGLHKSRYLKRIQGRPTIGRDGSIIARDSAVRLFDCVCCENNRYGIWTEPKVDKKN